MRVRLLAGVRAGVRACAYVYDYYIILLYMRGSVYVRVWVRVCGRVRTCVHANVYVYVSAGACAYACAYVSARV